MNLVFYGMHTTGLKDDSFIFQICWVTTDALGSVKYREGVTVNHIEDVFEGGALRFREQVLAGEKTNSVVDTEEEALSLFLEKTYPDEGEETFLIAPFAHFTRPFLEQASESKQFDFPKWGILEKAYAGHVSAQSFFGATKLFTGNAVEEPWAPPKKRSGFADADSLVLYYQKLRADDYKQTK